jgi:NADPH:quinone reductase-like Zn-dependent oxidoreductase
MRAIAVNEYGAEPAVMALPKPKPGPGQILIKIRAAGMNPMDRAISEGEWKATMPGTFPLVLGSDVAGVVEAVGQNATRFSRGDVVLGQLEGKEMRACNATGAARLPRMQSRSAEAFAQPSKLFLVRRGER